MCNAICVGNSSKSGQRIITKNMKNCIVAASIALSISLFNIPTPAQTKPNPILELRARVDRGDRDAIATMVRQASEGDSNAQYYLGVMYANGQGVPQSDIEAVNWFRKSAEQGNPDGENSLGNMYAVGQGVPQDDAEAIRWYIRAAGLNYTVAEISLGNMYAAGRGVPQNTAEALKWYRKAIDGYSDEGVKLYIKTAENADARSQDFVADLYSDGLHLKPDAAEALKWSRKAAKQGYASAQGSIGSAYYTGSGVAQNYVEAEKWFRIAANQGDIPAIHGLAMIYSEGKGVRKNLRESLKWWRKLAEKGIYDAQIKVRDMYARGEGTAKNVAEAEKWQRMVTEQDEEFKKISASANVRVEFGVDYYKNDSTSLPIATGTIILYAGNIDGPGSTDGNALDAQFNNGSCENMGSLEKGIAVDTDGNVYIADEGNETIRKLDTNGIVTTYAGKAGFRGSADGHGAEARFNCPTAVAIDRGGNLYVADSGNFTIRKITPSREVSTLAGKAGEHGKVDGKGASARFHRTRGIAVNSDGVIYVADTFNHAIRQVSPDGVVTTLAGGSGKVGLVDGSGSKAQFNNPVDVAVDSQGFIFVADRENQAVRRISPTGTVTTFLGADIPAGKSSEDSLSYKEIGIPNGIGTDNQGDLFVTTNKNVFKVSADGKFSILAGKKNRNVTDWIGNWASFGDPGHAALDHTGALYFADNYSIRKISPDGTVTTVSGKDRKGGSNDGIGNSAQFHHPRGIAADTRGNIYVNDVGNAVIRKISSAGEVSVFAGTLGKHAYKDGVGTAAELNADWTLVADNADNLYFTDVINHVVRKIDKSGAVSTFAGVAGLSGDADGVGAHARFRAPRSIASDGLGNLYVYDSESDNFRKIDSAGDVSTLKGIALKGLVEDLNSESVEIAADSLGNLYVTVAESVNETIRKISRVGAITTIVGNGGKWRSDNGSLKTLPRSPVADAAGNVYFFDAIYSTICKVTPDGNITTIAGTPKLRGITLGTPGSLDEVMSIAILNSQTLAVTSGNAVLKVTIP